MVKLNLKRRKNQEEEILEDVDLTAIVEQRRKRSQESKVEEDKETKRRGEKTSPSSEAESNEKPDVNSNVAATTILSIDSYLQERFFMWLIEQAINSENEFNMLMEAVDRMDIDRLRMLCKVALRRLKEKAS